MHASTLPMEPLEQEIVKPAAINKNWLKIKKRWIRRRLPGTSACEDTDTCVTTRFSTDESDDIRLSPQKILPKECSNTFYSQEKVASEAVSKQGQQFLPGGFTVAGFENLEDAEDTDTTSRHTSVPELGRALQAKKAPGRLRGISHASVDSGSDNETELEPMPWQRRRRGGVCCGGIAKSVLVPTIFAKEEQTSLILQRSLGQCALFKDLSPIELEVIANTMVLETIHKGRRIVQQGKMGNALYVIFKGCVSCYLEHAMDMRHHLSLSSEEDGVAFLNAASRLGDEFIRNRHEGEIFGELSVIWNMPRTLSVYAKEDCILGRLDRDVYQALVVHRAIHIREQHALCLRSAKLLETLSDEQIANLVDALELKSFKKGEAIIMQGDDGEDFFIVQSGECSAKVRTGNDEQEHRRYVKGDLFGELALINKAPRAASIIALTDVEVLRLSCRSFERMLGSLALLQKDSYKADPRKVIADFFRPGDSSGPLGSLQQREAGRLEQPLSSWFAVFRPTSRDAIAKMLNGNAVGKGLNVKGKSAKKNHLSGFVPFLQISDNNHKQAIEKMPDHLRVRIFYRSAAARQNAFERLSAAQLELRAQSKRNHIAQLLKSSLSFDRRTTRSRISMIPTESKTELPRITFDDRYIPHAYGIFVPADTLQEVYIMQADLSPIADWETGRKSEPAFMDMNMKALCHKSSPQIVLYQHDEGAPMNPMGLLIAYAEQFVKPVVSDFDAFLIASKGVNYAKLSEEQTALVVWCLDAAHDILKADEPESWMSQWLDFLKSENRKGFHPDTPKTGFGDPTSVRLIEDVIAHTSSCGAVRHGAECFNYYFPQELDEEYLVVWDEFPGIPWKYMTEAELRQFLIERVHAGFSFPINPVWPVRDPGWYDVLAALRNSNAAKENLDAWYPAEADILQKIDQIHAEFPNGFHSTYQFEASITLDVDFCLHQLSLERDNRMMRFRKFSTKIWPGSWPVSPSLQSKFRGGLSRVTDAMRKWRNHGRIDTE